MSVSSAPVKVRKRSGRVVDYHRQKITQAVKFCFVNSCAKPDSPETLALADRVAGMVEKLVKKMTGPVDVETIQDLVERELLAIGERDAAKAYIDYRDEHRKLREAMAIPAADVEAVQADGQYFSSELARFQHYNKYARYNDALKRRELAGETLGEDGRVLRFFDYHLAKHGMPALAPELRRALSQAMLKGEAAPSMRLMQMAGPAAERCNAHIYNCCYAAISDLDYIPEILYLSMCGTGNGFSVEGQAIQQLPQIKRRRAGATPDTFVIPDTTEGWCDSVKHLLYRLYDGHDLAFDYSGIRKAGERLRTKGGTASGPEPLKMLHDMIRRAVRNREGLRLTPLDVHDIMCYVGKVGQIGNVRRGAMISLSDLDSAEMAEAKSGAFWQDPLKLQRTVANNSAVYEQKPTMEKFMAEWLRLVQSKSGERGIFNRGSIPIQIPRRRQALYGDERVAWGLNPCGEVILRPTGQMCNLSQAIVRPDDTEIDLLGKLELATIFGTIQSTMTDFNYLRPIWAQNCQAERLLGVDLGGALDCRILRPSNPDQPALLQRLRDHVVHTNQRWAQHLGINPSTAATVIKPGGNSGARWGIGQSMSGWLSKHMIRFVEVGNMDPMCRFLKDEGVYHETCYRDPGTTVFGFPLQAPEGALIVSELVTDADGKVVETKPLRSAIDQLENWLTFKTCYTEHNPSVTIHVADHEWLAVGAWIYAHWDQVGGLAFLPLDGHVYPQSPFTPVTEKAFDEFKARFPERIAWEKLARYEDGRDHRSGEPACDGDKCTFNPAR